MYQAHIHNEPNKNPKGYARFLCQSPLFDPKDLAEAKRPQAKKDAEIDD
jgi:hypothetical protein